jgi:hypothetical protein
MTSQARDSSVWSRSWQGYDAGENRLSTQPHHLIAFRSAASRAVAAISCACAVAFSEIQFARNGDNPGLDKFHAHVCCFAAWEFERNEQR